VSSQPRSTEVDELGQRGRTLVQVRELIATIGVGCRFPQGDNPVAFWELLAEGVEAISETPAERFPVERTAILFQRHLGAS